MHATTLFTTLALFSAALINAYDPVKMLCLVNQQRLDQGLRPLGMNQALANAAQEHSDDQARMNTMTHDGSDGSQPGDRVQKAGYNWMTVAENVAYGYSDEETCMQEWMNSPGHRENILGDYTHFGSAVGYSGSTPYYTQDFAGDGKSYNFPECPSSADYSDQSAGADNYSGQAPSPDYSGGQAPSSYDGQAPSNYDDQAPSSYDDQEPSNYGGQAPSNYDSQEPSNYSQAPSNYGGQAPSNYGQAPSNYGQAPSNNYRGSAPSSGRRHKSVHRRKPVRKTNHHNGNVSDNRGSRRPSYGNVNDNHSRRPTSYKQPTSSYKTTTTYKQPTNGNVDSNRGARKPSNGGAYRAY